MFYTFPSLFFLSIHLAFFLFLFKSHLSFLLCLLIARFIRWITTPSLSLYFRFFLTFFFLHQSPLNFPLCFIYSPVCLSFLFHSFSFCRNRPCVRKKTGEKVLKIQIFYMRICQLLCLFMWRRMSIVRRAKVRLSPRSYGSRP